MLRRPIASPEALKALIAPAGGALPAPAIYAVFALLAEACGRQGATNSPARADCTREDAGRRWLTGVGFFGHRKSIDELRAEQRGRLHRTPASRKQIAVLESLTAENPERALKIGLARLNGMYLQLSRLQAKVLIAVMLEEDWRTPQRLLRRTRAGELPDDVLQGRSFLTRPVFEFGRQGQSRLHAAKPTSLCSSCPNAFLTS